MSKTMLKEEIEIYSEKYDIHGVVRDYGVVTKLSFSYEGKDIEMAIHIFSFCRNSILGEKDNTECDTESWVAEYKWLSLSKRIMNTVCSMSDETGHTSACLYMDSGRDTIEKAMGQDINPSISLSPIA